MNLKSKLNFRNNLLLLVVVAFVFAAGVGGYSYYKWANRIVPEELMDEALNKTLEAKNYRYDLLFKLIVDGNARILSDIKGEKNGNKFHIKGKMLGQEVEVFQLEDTLYMKDSLSGRWMERQGTNILNNEYFLAEVDPLAAFSFTQITDLQFHGLEKSEEGQFYFMELKTSLDNKMLNKFWKDFSYKLWIDKKTHVISKSEIMAYHKENSQNKMVMQIELYDYGKKIKIVSPLKNK